MGKWCLHASSFIFDQIIIKVAGNQDRHKNPDKFNFSLWFPWRIYGFWNERSSSSDCGWSKNLFFSSPEPWGSQGELIVYPCSGVRRCRCRCRQQCLNIFSCETAWPIKAKLYVEPPWEGETKVYINGPGHMTKMASMPIYGKNL